MGEGVFIRGEKEFRSILQVWQIEVALGPSTPPSMEELGPPIDDRDRKELQDYIDSWDQKDANDRHDRLAARVAFAEGLLRLWDALHASPRGES